MRATRDREGTAMGRMRFPNRTLEAAAYFHSRRSITTADPTGNGSRMHAMAGRPLALIFFEPLATRSTNLQVAVQPNAHATARLPATRINVSRFSISFHPRRKRTIFSEAPPARQKRTLLASSS